METKLPKVHSPHTIWTLFSSHIFSPKPLTITSLNIHKLISYDSLCHIPSEHWQSCLIIFSYLFCHLFKTLRWFQLTIYKMFSVGHISKPLLCTLEISTDSFFVACIRVIFVSISSKSSSFLWCSVHAHLICLCGTTFLLLQVSLHHWWNCHVYTSI